MKVLIVDDENLGRKKIVSLLDNHGFSDNIHEASSGKQAIALIEELNPDIVFLDIQMTDMSGFDVLLQLDPENLPVIIFATAFDNYAVKAFEYQAVDFLLKPFKQDRFSKAFERALQVVDQNEKLEYQNKINRLIEYIDNSNNEVLTEKSNYINQITIKTKNKYYFVSVDDIKYIKSSAYYAELFLIKKKKQLCRITSMTNLMSKLNPKLFIRVNRSSIIRLDYIEKLVSEGMGDYSIVMLDGEAFHLTKKYKDEFLKVMNVKQK